MIECQGADIYNLNQVTEPGHTVSYVSVYIHTEMDTYIHTCIHDLFGNAGQQCHLTKLTWISFP